MIKVKNYDEALSLEDDNSLYLIQFNFLSLPLSLSLSLWWRYVYFFHLFILDILQISIFKYYSFVLFINLSLPFQNNLGIQYFLSFC